MRLFIPFLAVGVALATVSVNSLRAEDKTNDKAAAEAVEKVVRTYLDKQHKPSACEQNLKLCLDGASFSYFWTREGKVGTTTVKDHVAETIKALKKEGDQPTTVKSVKVVVHGKTGLAVAIAEFQSVGTTYRDVFTLSLRGDAWKIAAIVQEMVNKKEK
jgi:hypothetical protein